MRLFLEKKCGGLALRVLPWAIAGGILVWLFRLYPIDQIANAFKLANLFNFFAFALFYFAAVLAIDTFGVSALLTRFGHPATGRTVLPLRAATYPLSLINYGAGQLSFAYYLRRRLQIPVGDVIGLFTLITVMDLVWVVTLAFFGSFIGHHAILGVNITPTVRLVGIITYCLVAAHLLFWLMHWENRLQGRSWQHAFAWLQRKRLFRIFHVARLGDYCRLALWRAPIHLLLVISIYVIIHAFHGTIPFLAAAGNVPIAILIGVIPISWGGIGTSNKALIDLLAPHVALLPTATHPVSAPELILAVSLLWMFTNYLFKLLIGLLTLRHVQSTTKKTKNTIFLN
ncbi:MAG: flippase-like domain-containing protein [Deltaproteobacteria bacterium]|nr:flippase-like domain-containing protein [Deltaproteobacteria bacterium]